MTDDFPAPRPGRPQQPVFIAAIVVAVLALGVVLWLWGSVRALESRESLRDGKVDTQLTDMGRREEALAGEDRRIGDAIAALNAGHEGIARRVDSLYGARRSGLLAAEAEHLSRLAAQRLALMQDPAGALALLGAADAALREIRGADTHAARAALARDSAMLQNASALDVEAAWLRLAALPDAVDIIAASHVAPAAAHPGPAPAHADAVPASAWERFRRALLSLVSIRHVDEPLTPMITAGERELAAQNFRLLTEQAQLALLQRRAGIYRHALDEAGRWLDRIAAGDPAHRARTRQELASLQALDIGQPLPDLTASLNATRALAVQLLPEADAAPAATAPAGGASR